MRFLHIADLHIGKQLSDVSFLEDQRFILSQIADIARDEKVDGVLIAGDVYQKTAPAAEAMEVFDQFITALVQMEKKVFIISGNHDSALRISYFSGLLRNSGVYITEKFDGRLQTVSLRDRDGEICVHMLPFLKPANVRKYLPEAKAQTYQEAMQAVLEASPVDTAKRNILLCHQFITGSETCDSEEKAVGGLDNIDASLFDAFDYVALGHIHRPQRLMRDTLRYAGSPLKYSFSEVEHKKSVTIVDLEEKGEVSIRKIPLAPLRDMRIVEGGLDSLLQMDYSEDYIWAVVTDEMVAPDAKRSLRMVFHNMLKFTVKNSKTRYDVDVLAKEAMEKKTMEALFVDFFRLQMNDQPPTDAHMQLLNKIKKEMEDEAQ